MKEKTVDDVFAMLAERGGARYGNERVSVLAHSLQCGLLAREAGASPALVTAALLHDFGHILHDREMAAAEGVDMVHEELGAKWLSRLFGDEVTTPIRLHVPAKRYLCAVEPAYFDGLSAGSVRSLELQGGPFSPEEAAAFIAIPHAEEAVLLRRWDDAAKVKGLETPPLEAFRPLAQSVARPA